MRPPAFLILTVTALIASGCGKGANQVLADSWHIKLDVQCKPNGKVVVDIDPFVAYVDTSSSNKKAKWSLGKDGDAVNSVTIEPKEGGDWPFEGARSHTVPKGQAVESGEVKSGVALRRAYPYNIKTTCSIGGQNRVIVIDPDMIIID